MKNPRNVFTEKEWYKRYHGVSTPSAAAAAPVAEAPFVLVGRGDALVGRSLLLSKLWKKFCNTSCCVWPVGLGVVATFGEDGGRPPGGGAPPPVEDAKAAGRLLAAVREDAILRAAAAVSATLELAPPPPTSISESARTTFGMLKVPFPSGPTIPAEAPSRSAGLRKAPRGSRSGFLAFSS